MIHAVILAGGKGTRFWPLSRETWPKQMLNILGEDTLLRHTIRRLDGFDPALNLWIVTTEDLAQDIRFHLEPLGKEGKKIDLIIEPIGRNTAAAIGLAAVTLYNLSPESVMIAMPSDHAVTNIKEFQEKLRLAIEVAEHDYLVTFGIRPRRPETGYGYIELGQPLMNFKGEVFHAKKFFEKPNLKTAEAFVQQVSFYWNSGIFVWKAFKIMKEIESHLPNLYQGLQKIAREKDLKSERVREVYASFENISIDYGILEKSGAVVVVPSDFGWSDLGSWTALDDVLEKDANGNIRQGKAIDIGSRDSTIIAGERVVATLGLKNMVVVDTPDATLVSSKESVQEVRRVVEILQKEQREEHLVHRTVERPWGSYTVLEKGDRYKIKRIVLKPRARLSLQLHRHRSEHWVVISGMARVTRDEEVFDVHAGESTFIPALVKHRLENPGTIPLKIIEVQNGEYVEEDDIERYDDDFGRK